ncbi:Aste57867_21134 [Aphanomyces stellatus]|uniref:Aste57867_21134 protein n=1 Tax=Aphanomyces stellatus TaxID=120398 RepID=A0A485LI00_9STRA|nr:hypothetical protein As57867_021066 [Aphanomyces stellatus]VFT97808.1 Aste57867_21134 [Aphanomyces stellatus]
MPYNRPPPEQRSRQPDRFYSVNQANVYHSDGNNGIQKDLTLMALSLLPADYVSSPLLDLGCGSGLSTQHLPPLSVGIDISLSMLQLAETSHSHGFVCAAAFALPLRSRSFDYVISISMLQWLSPDQLVCFFHELARVMTPTGSAVLQVYPLDLPHANEMLAAARDATGKAVFFVADFPHANSALKWFLCIDVPLSTDSEHVHGKDVCPLARRMDGTCAYRYRRRRGLAMGRLVLEHIQYAWHAYRKLMREHKLQAQGGTDPAKRHRKERRIFPNEERLVGQLIAALGASLTRDDLIGQGDLVVDLMHKTFTV